MQIYFGFKGRLARMPYFLYGLVLGVIWVAFVHFVLKPYINPYLQENNFSWWAFAAIMLYAVVTFWISFALVIKRLHDYDYNGWWSLLNLIPLVNLIFGLFLLFYPGTKGSNRFGPPPV
jgi:uncharacterized membrane protein YhaH (DUF805 family)